VCPQKSFQTTIDSIIDFKYNKNDISPAQQSAGGGCQNRDVDNNSIRNSEGKNSFNVDIEHKAKPERVEKVKKSAYTTSNINVEGFKLPRKVNPKDHQTVDELFERCNYWWVKRYRKDSGTWERYESLLRKMEKHEIFPINLFDPQPDQVVAQLDFLEAQIKKQQEGEYDHSGIYAIINRWKSIKALMHSYGRLKEVKDNWNYMPPSLPKPKPRIIPSITTVHKLIHHKYSTDIYETKLYQYIALFSYVVGFRTASEMSILKTTDIDFDSGILTYYQPKTDTWRSFVVPDRLIDSKNTKCLKEWIDSWRPQVENQYSKDFMFIQPSGKPFTKKFMTTKLRKMLIPVWNSYYPYNSRHWYATGRLIQTKLKYGVYGLKEVCDELEHSSVKITENYIRTVNKWYKIQPFDWFKALLRLPKFVKENLEQFKGLETVDSKKRAVLTQFPPVEGYGPARVNIEFLLLYSTVEFRISRVLLKPLTLNLSLFFCTTREITFLNCVFFSLKSINLEIPDEIPDYDNMILFWEVSNGE